MIAPWLTDNFKAPCRSPSISRNPTPMYPRDTRPRARNCGRIAEAPLIGTAKPMLLARAQAASVGELDDDSFHAVDDVLVGENAAVGIDDEPAARSTPRAVATKPIGPLEEILRGRQARTPPAAIVAARRRGVDIDNRRIDPLDDVRKIDQR